MEYCDLIANLLTNGLKDQTAQQDVVFFGIKSKSDLHPELGYLLSTAKTIECQDNKGNRYKITVEANSKADNVVSIKEGKSIQEKLKESNMRHSRNGDQLGYLMDQLRLKLDYSPQDPTILKEITEEEISALVHEVLCAKEESTSESF